jgi:hypothetical protein
MGSKAAYWSRAQRSMTQISYQGQTGREMRSRRERITGSLARGWERNQTEVTGLLTLIPLAGTEARAAAARVLAAAGQFDEAEAMARSAGRPQVLAQVAESLAAARLHERGEAMARSITDGFWQVRALAQLTGVLTAAGQYDHAATAAEDAETVGEVALGTASPAGQARAVPLSAVPAVVPGGGYRGGLAWRVISVATTSVMCSVPGGRMVSFSRRVMRTWRAIVAGGGGPGVRLRWSL